MQYKKNYIKIYLAKSRKSAKADFLLGGLNRNLFDL